MIMLVAPESRRKITISDANHVFTTPIILRVLFASFSILPYSALHVILTLPLHELLWCLQLSFAVAYTSIVLLTTVSRP